MARFSLKAADGRRVTNDMLTGASLTSNPGLCYVWDSYEKAEQQRVAYEVILGAKLTVVPSPSFSLLGHR
jgi:hypothetical protein